MSTRLDVSPQRRLRHLFPNLSEKDVRDALHVASGDEVSAERVLAELSRVVVTVPRPPSTLAPPPLTSQQRLAKCAVLLARSPPALDILFASLSKVAADPTVEKFRKVDLRHNPVFRDRVAPCPGAVELLYTVGYEPLHGWLVLQNYDAAAIRSGLEALGAAKQGREYCEAKALLAAEQVARAAAAQDEVAAASRRAVALAKVPAEPTAGGDSTSACQITIHVGSAQVARRRFDSENTLEDVLNYVKSLEAAPPGQFVLENITTAPSRVLDPTTQRTCSLYALDLWPVGRVRARAAA